MSDGKVTAGSIVITVRQIEGELASLHGFHVSREETSLWDQSATADAMAEILAAGQCQCVEAVHERGPYTNAFGLGFLLFPQELPRAAHDVFGVAQLIHPRIIVIVNSALRGQGVGREMTRQLLDLARARRFSEVEVEADGEQRQFFEWSQEFVAVPNGVRQHRLGELVLLRKQLD